MLDPDLLLSNLTSGLTVKTALIIKSKSDVNVDVDPLVIKSQNNMENIHLDLSRRASDPWGNEVAVFLGRIGSGDSEGVTVAPFHVLATSAKRNATQNLEGKAVCPDQQQLERIQSFDPSSAQAAIGARTIANPQSNQIAVKSAFLETVERIQVQDTVVNDIKLDQLSMSTAITDPSKIMSIKGVHLSYMNQLIETWTVEALEGKTTAEVNIEFVMPRTIEQGRSLCDQLSRSENVLESEAVGDSEWFISHAWSYKFLDVVEAINLFFQSYKGKGKLLHEEDPVIWFDLFSNSQHATGERPFEWWKTTFMSAIKEMKNVVMVCLPWDDPITLTRSWCAYEVYAAKQTQSNFHVAMTRAEEQRFFSSIASLSLTNIFGRISLRRSQAFKQSDRDAIFRVIDENFADSNGKGGSEKLDEMVLSVMREWIVQILDEKIQGSEGCMYQMLGKLNASLEILETTFANLRKDFGDIHQLTASALMMLTQCHGVMGDYLSAEALISEWAPKYEEQFGSNHPLVLMLKLLLGSLLADAVQYNKAETIIIEIVQVIQSLGESHPMSERAAELLGMLHMHRGRYESACLIFQKSFEYQKEKFGATSPDAITSQLCVGICYTYMKEYEKALPLMEDGLIFARASLGESHLVTRSWLVEIGNLYNRIDHAEEAILVNDEAMSGCLEQHGQTQMMKTRAAIGLSEAYRRLGRHSEAKILLETLVFPNEPKVHLHPLFSAKLTYGQVLVGLGAVGEGIDEIRRVLERAENEFGVEHIFVRDIRQVFEELA
ncbi:hypothetical protein CcCBS67573_g05954 [Chytriomyces confervae]|uniref:MalT-like TPR region domain-containing protein n=1 Tax=Chytriomyces confervae TaxID=246404 RepID=A0A507F7D5_9FUNG|nr:hypothetical protein CcCBS67573_g05954 [Chytriomyces confervae]